MRRTEPTAASCASTTTIQMRYSARSKASSCREFSFTPTQSLSPSPHQFITQDEIDKLLRDGGSTSGGKWRIFRYFTEEHSVEDKADFLKREYGIGGRSHALSDAPGSDENHDAKGMDA